LGDGRTGQLGVVERPVRAGPEPDISADGTVDDGIARDNLAFAGRAIAHHPIATLREGAGPVASIIAPASSNDFMARSCQAVSQ
jgi:hypothetical protein